MPGSPEGSDSLTGGGTLRVGLVADPVSIDPAYVVDDEGDLVVAALFDPLVRLDADMRVVPSAAHAWEVSEDGRTVRFSLRRSTFHDGTPVTAHDFERAFQRIVDETRPDRSTVGFLLDDVEGVDVARAGGPFSGVVVEDDHTLVIHLSGPRPRAVAMFAHASLVPVPASAVGDPTTFGEQPIGNGPFQMLEPRERGAFVRVARYDDHPSPPTVDDVLFTVYDSDPDGDRQWQDLQAGLLHVARITPERVEEARDVFGAAIGGREGPGLVDAVSSTVYLYGFALDVAPYDDVRVRRALSMAVDREVIAESLGETRSPAGSIVPPSIPGSRPGVCDHCIHDPVSARELWDAYVAERAARDEAVPLLTLTHNRGATHAAIAEQMAGQIEEALDVQVVLRAHDLQVFLRNVSRGEVGMFRLGWQPTEPHAGSYLRPLFHTDSIGLENLTGFSDPEVDLLLDAALEAPFPGTAIVRWREAEARILDQMPVLPLLYYHHSLVIAPDVQGLTWPVFGPPDLSRVTIE
ncbi:MAG: ABC transporter substrate-binding protein [Nitriliruptoraceae bacterium]